MATKKYAADDNRLCCVADTARKVMQFYREERVRCTRLMAGNRYSTNSYLKKTYINLLALYVSIVSRNLISQNPRVMLSTFYKEQKPAVAGAESWMNKQFVEQDFAGSMQRMVLDALFSVGIAKIAIATPGDAATLGNTIQQGQPFLSRIDLDDWVYDHRARDFGEVQFMGHRYRMRKDHALDFDHFDKKARKQLEVSYQIAYNREGDERIGEIGRDFHGYDEDLYDMVDLWEIYLPQEGVVKTFTEHDLSGPSSAWEGAKPIALREQKWLGPDTGPYVTLGLGWVPGNIHPKGPVLDIVDLHELVNECYRKLARQFARLKKITGHSRSQDEDGEAINKASDGQSVGLLNPESVKDITVGGGDPGLAAFAVDATKRFKEMAGNLDTLGGLAPQAQTLGQEELLQQQSSGLVATMQDATTAFVSKCADNLLWYYWHDPRLVMQTPYSHPNLPDIHMVRQIHPMNHPDPSAVKRQGPKPDLKIDPYSMKHTTPQQRVKDLLTIVQQVYQPMAQAFMQAGMQLDLPKLIAMLAKNLDAPDLPEIVSVGEPMGPQQGGDGNAPGDSSGGKPAETTRNYVRRSLGGGSAQAQKMEADNSLAAAMAKNGHSPNGRK